MRVEANRPQGQFLLMPQKFRAFVGGFGSGKTWVGTMAKCGHYLKHPKINQGYFAPTYPHIRDIFYPTVEEVAHGYGMKVEIREGNKEVHFYRGPYYLGTTICRSMDRPESIVGFKIGHALVDEFDILDPSKAKQAWRKIIARMRYKVDGLKNGVDVATTAEGFRETYRLFVEQVSQKPGLGDTYGIIQASTYENEKNLPDDYIQSLLDTYPAELIEAYLLGQFCNLTSGTVYRAYNRKTHVSDEVIRERDVLHVGMDFNILKAAATFYVIRDGVWHAVFELKDKLDTPDMIASIKERFSQHRIIVYADASGANRKSNSASESDIALLKKAGFEIRANAANPPVKDRVAAANKAFQDGRLKVNPKTAPTTAACLEKQAYDSNGDPDKKSGFDHQNDATTYPIAYTFPIQSRIARSRELKL